MGLLPPKVHSILLYTQQHLVSVPREDYLPLFEAPAYALHPAGGLTEGDSYVWRAGLCTLPGQKPGLHATELSHGNLKQRYGSVAFLTTTAAACSRVLCQ